MRDLSMSANSTPTTPPAPTMTFPGGDDAPGYRWAFRVFSVLFLLTLCAGLANFVLPKLARMFG